MSLSALQKKGRATWDDVKDRVLIDELLHQARIGRRAGNGFMAEAWQAATRAYNKKFAPVVDIEQVKSRMKHVRSSISVLLVFYVYTTNK